MGSTDFGRSVTVAFVLQARDLMGSCMAATLSPPGQDEHLDFVSKALQDRYELKKRGRLGRWGGGCDKYRHVGQSDGEYR